MNRRSTIACDRKKCGALTRRVVWVRSNRHLRPGAERLTLGGDAQQLRVPVRTDLLGRGGQQAGTEWNRPRHESACRMRQVPLWCAMTPGGCLAAEEAGCGPTDQFGTAVQRRSRRQLVPDLAGRAARCVPGDRRFTARRPKPSLLGGTRAGISCPAARRSRLGPKCRLERACYEAVGSKPGQSGTGRAPNWRVAHGAFHSVARRHREPGLDCGWAPCGHRSVPDC